MKTMRRHDNTTRARAIAQRVKDSYDAVNTVLKKSEIPNHYYSLGKPIDKCASLEYNNGKWYVYEGNRGRKIHVKSFNSVYDAGCELFERVAIGGGKLTQMRSSLALELNKKASLRGNNSPRRRFLSEQGWVADSSKRPVIFAPSGPSIELEAHKMVAPPIKKAKIKGPRKGGMIQADVAMTPNKGVVIDAISVSPVQVQINGAGVTKNIVIGRPNEVKASWEVTDNPPRKKKKKIDR